MHSRTRLPVNLREEIEDARGECLGPVHKQPVAGAFDDHQLRTVDALVDHLGVFDRHWVGVPVDDEGRAANGLQVFVQIEISDGLENESSDSVPIPDGVFVEVQVQPGNELLIRKIGFEVDPPEPLDRLWFAVLILIRRVDLLEQRGVLREPV